MNYDSFQVLVYAWIALGVVVFIVLFYVTAPYGRHTTAKWGPQISNRLGWVLMEVPVMMVLMFIVLSHATNITVLSWTLIGFFMFHYLNRTFIFPFRIRTKGKKMPLIITFSAIAFNLINGFFLGYYFSHFAPQTGNYFLNLHFILGVILFFGGMYINWIYDSKLIHLRHPTETNYILPKGGLFEYISCPNLFGEIVEWTGFAIMCWNLSATAFFVWTLANLIPRAYAHHRWYLKTFDDYPKNRKAVFPFIL